MTTPWTTAPSDIDELPLRPRRAMEDARSRVSIKLSAMLLWERVLTCADRERLGGDFEKAWRDGGAIGIWMRLRGVSEPRAIIDLAVALEFMTEGMRRWLLQETKELLNDPDEALDYAIRTTDLVLTERPRAAFWRKTKVEIDWDNHSALWDYFWTLCRHSKLGKSVDDTLFGESVKPGYAAKTKSRLVNQSDFPPSLATFINPAGRGTQKLDLRPDQIRLFSLESTEVLRESVG